jgi:type I restriction enzyme M protein
LITGAIKGQIDRIWDAFWSGGISNPLEVIEQITYLLFLRRLDDLHTLEENKSARLKRPMERRVFPKGKDAKGRAYDDLRWSRFKHFAPADMYTVVGEHVFPFLRTLGANGTNEDSTYAHHMKDARFTIPTAALLAKVVDLIDAVPLEDRDTKGDLYEYMLGKIASAGQNGQFRTPRHIIRLMVEMTAPQPKDVICDPACGTAGFLIAAGEYLRLHHPKLLLDVKLSKHFHRQMFHGFDFDNTMLRIGSMNMLLHGVENPDIRYRDSLAQDHAGEEEKYTLVLANPPFAGSLDYENTAKDLLQIVKTLTTSPNTAPWNRQDSTNPHSPI